MSCPEVDQIMLHKTEQYPLPWHESWWIQHWWDHQGLGNNWKGNKDGAQWYWSMVECLLRVISYCSSLLTQLDICIFSIFHWTEHAPYQIEAAQCNKKKCWQKPQQFRPFPWENGWRLPSHDKHWASQIKNGWLLVGESTVRAEANDHRLERKKGTPRKPAHELIQTSDLHISRTAFIFTVLLLPAI